jgi:hypothetical protein
MVRQVIAENTYGYPSIITTDPKSRFETPELFESLGFQTYLKMSGFCYMVHGDIADVRMKLLAHITMTNVWNSTKGDWLRLKSEWLERIEAAGVIGQGIESFQVAEHDDTDVLVHRGHPADDPLGQHLRACPASVKRMVHTHVQCHWITIPESRPSSQSLAKNRPIPVQHSPEDAHISIAKD